MGFNPSLWRYYWGLLNNHRISGKWKINKRNGSWICDKWNGTNNET